MAYVNNMPDEEENKNPAQGTVPPSGGGVQLSPSGGVGSVGSPGGAPGAAPKSGGQFATLDKYISANQGQAEPLANKLTSGINKEYSTLEGQNVATLGDIGNQVATNTLPSNTNDVIAKEAANPVSFTGDQGNVKQFQSLLDASYAGPASAESTPGFTAQQNAVNNAIAAGKQATTTEGGRKQLLAKNEAAPSNSVTGLNSAILSQSPTALGQVESAYKPFSNLLTNLSTGAQGINQNISKAKSDTMAANAAANKQIAEQVQNLNTGITSALGNAQEATNKYNQRLADTQSNLNKFHTYLEGYNGASGFNIADPFAQYEAIQPQVDAPTIEQVATPENFQQFNALRALLGDKMASPLAGVDSTKAGTFNVPTIPSIDYAGLGTGLGKQIITQEGFNQGEPALSGHTITNADMARQEQDKASYQALANLIRQWGGQWNPIYMG